MLGSSNLYRNSNYSSLFSNTSPEKLAACSRIDTREMNSTDDLKTDDYRFYADIHVRETRMPF